MNAAHAVQDAELALQAMAPNGRDYYPQGDRAILQAQAEHRARLQKIGEVYAELLQIFEHLEG